MKEFTPPFTLRRTEWKPRYIDYSEFREQEINSWDEYVKTNSHRNLPDTPNIPSESDIEGINSDYKVWEELLDDLHGNFYRTIEDLEKDLEDHSHHRSWFNLQLYDKWITSVAVEKHSNTDEETARPVYYIGDIQAAPPIHVMDAISF